MKRRCRAPRTAPLTVTLIAAVATAVLVMCAATFLRSYRAAAVENARTSSAQMVSQVADTVGNYVQTLDETINGVMKEMYATEDGRDAYLNAWLDARSEVVAVTTYNASGAMLECWALDHTPRTTILQNLSFDLATAQANPGGYITAPHVESIFEGYYPWVVTIVRPMPNGVDTRWVAVDVRFSGLGGSISGVGIGQHGYCYLMDDQGNMVYHPQQQLLYAGIKNEENERLAAQPDGTYVEDTVIYSVQNVPASNWRVVGVSYIDETVNESFEQMARITLGSSALILAAALLVGWIISHMLSRPLQQLENAMEQFEQDADGFTFQPVAGTREVQELSDSFGHMVGRIQRLMNTVREEEVILRKTELKALQAQINPHFLYNTLDSIRWIATMQKNSGIVQMVTSLSSLLRNMAKGFNEKVTLQQELEFLNDYVVIEKVRYLELFDLQTEVTSPQLYQARIIKLTLQPLVENAIFNGIEPSGRTGLIKIRAWTEETVLYVSVTDNGIGMSPEQCKKVLTDTSRVTKSTMSGIGLPNVDRRFKLVYGDEYGLTIESELDSFTRITVSLPLEY